MRGRGWKFAALGALTAVLAASGAASAEEGVPPWERAKLEATVIPKVLPKDEAVPVGLEVRSLVQMPAGAGSPPLRSIRLRLDRDLRFDFAEVPACFGGSSLEPIGLDDLERECPEAIVGRGEAEITISLPDVPVAREEGPVLVLNGSRREGPQRLFLVTESTVPVPALLVATASIRDRRRDDLGPLVEIEFPRIAAGAGSLSRLRFRVNRRVVDGARSHPVLSASCSDGALRTEGEATYVYAGTEIVHSEQRSRRCGRR